MLLENMTYPQDLRVRREAIALTAAGYQVSVICPARQGQPYRETLAGVRLYRYPSPPQANSLLGYFWEYGFSMAATFVLSLVVFLGDGFDVVHAHNPPDMFVFIAAFYKLFGKHFIFDHHDLSPEMYQARFSGRGSPMLYRLLVFLEKLTCRLADHVIATNESYKKIEMERGGVPEARITIVRNGVELRQLQRVEPDPTLRQMGKAIIGYVGLMGFQDGVDYLLRALHHLLHDLGRRDFYCVLIGDGDARADLTALARHLGLEGYVHFTGLMPYHGFAPYLAAADICVDPDPSNAYSDRSTMFKMMEYMALGKPIVAFDLPEHRFTAQQAAVYVPPNDELAFARAIAGLMDDPLWRAAVASWGKRRIETQLAWEHSVPRLRAVYENVLRLPAARHVPASRTEGPARPRPLARVTRYQPGEPT
jgi:glycosyltransferase involved in cell wall biosynthesis